ncbi:hypothetical protein HDU76_001005 [Blyttiomyces sp. JEL0837]|nr:hypothetical protein HDU76_001005 [Blyttiomyces sp. JEL0837]
MSAVPAIRSCGANLVTFTPLLSTSGILSHLPTGSIINTALAESTNGLTGRTFNFSGTWNTTSMSVSFRSTDFLTDWPSNATLNPHLLLSVDGDNWTYSGVDAKIVAADPLRIGVAFSGTIGDAGWSYAQNQGVLESTSSFGNSIEFFMLQGLSYDEKEADAMVSSFIITNKLDVVVTATSGYMKKLCVDYPHVQFVTMSNDGEVQGNEGTIFPTLPKNFNAAFIRHDVGRYLSGIAAGAIAHDTGASSGDL